MDLKKHSFSFDRFLRGHTPRFLERFYPVLQRRGLQIVYLVLLFGLASGVVNAILEGSKPIYINALILPGRSAQTWSEVVINFFTMALGTLGIYIIYQSGKQRIRRRATEQYLGLGLLLLILAVLMGFAVLAEKGF
jgi:hypothetical protein